MTFHMDRKSVKVVVILILVASLLAVGKLVPTPNGLTREGFMALCIFLGTVVLWLGDFLPMWVAGIVMFFLFPWFGVMTISDCYKNFGSSSFFFILATFGIATTMSTTSLPGRICASVVVKYGKNSKMFLLVLMLAMGILSLMMSNLAVISIFISLIRPLVEDHCNGNTKSNLAKCLYIGLPIAANLGGFSSLSSSPANILLVDLLDKFSGIHVTYFNWMAVGLPFSILLKVVAWAILVWVFKPEPLRTEVIEKYKKMRINHEPLSTREKKGLVIIILTISFWLLSSWITVLNTTIIALISMALLMAPGLNVITWKDFRERTEWGIVMLLGIISGLVSGLTLHEVPKWIVTSLSNGISGFSPLLIIVICVLFMAALRNFLPTATAFVSFLALPMFGIAGIAGISSVSMLFLVAFWSQVILLIPYDPIYLVGYGDGYFSPADTSRAGSLILIPFIILSPIILIPLVKIFGY